jgi:hypothetical protein
MRHNKRHLIAVTALLFCLSAQAQEPTPSPTVGETLLHPLSITIGGHLDARSRATSEEVAVRYLGDQIEQKRAAEAATAQLPSFWRAFWKYLPKITGGTMNSAIAGDDDPAVTPAYLMLSARLLEREADASDKTVKVLFSK